MIRLVGLAIVAIVASVFASRDPFHVEIIPVTLCAITAALVYGRPTALMLLAAVSLVIAFSTGGDLAEFILTFSAAAGAILLSGRIRNRTRLVYVGFGVALIVLATCLGLGVLTGQSLEFSSDPFGNGQSTSVPLYASRLIIEALKQFAFVALCGPLMVGILPFIEKLFDIETDLSLLELGDMSHELLRQLAQRAPGTYNHSISVASLAESAAESIGAHGLLVRVGACFHDIGKMFKPNYFVENQMPGANRHDALQPELSTLVIIAHVKDGADLINLEDIGTLYVDFRLPERNQGKVVAGQVVELDIDAMPGRMFKAKVEAVDPLIDVNGRSIGVRAVMANTAGESALSPGGTKGAAAPAGAAAKPPAAAAEEFEEGGEEAGGVGTDSAFEAMTVGQLRSALKDRGLSVNGKKPALVRRLAAASAVPSSVS
jgi:putative nucleotidyltransferase with HDIG domain